MDTKEINERAVQAILTALLGDVGFEVVGRLWAETTKAMSEAHSSGYGTGFMDGIEGLEAGPQQTPDEDSLKREDLIDWSQSKMTNDTWPVTQKDNCDECDCLACTERREEARVLGPAW